jgi:hypothetical protein
MTYAYNAIAGQLTASASITRLSFEPAVCFRTNLIFLSFSRNMAADGPFPDDTERAFDIFLNAPDRDKWYQFGHQKQAEYRHWLLHPNSEVRGGTRQERQQQYNQKNKAVTKFELRSGQLWHKVTDTSSAKYVVCTYESFERIRYVHLKLEHAGVSKTYGRLKKRYYRIMKEEAAWLLARCIPCRV